MSSAILSYFTPNYAALEAITGDTRRKYCAKHGYEYIVHKEKNNKLYHSWKRLAIAYALFNQDKFSRIAIMDPDTMIMNSMPTLEEKMGDAEFMIAEDLYGVNAGVLLFKNSEKTRQFLYSMCSVGYLIYQNHPWREQGNIRDEISLAGPYSNWATVCKQNHINSYLHEEYGRPKFEGQYKEGDWIIQVPALPMHRRLKLMYEYYKKAT